MIHHSFLCESSSASKCHTEGGFKFPSDPELRRRWCIAIKREGPNKTIWTNTPNSVVCQKHFKPEDFKDPLSVTLGLKDCSNACRRFLKSGVVPSVFSFTASETSTKRDSRNEERRARAEKRIKLKEEQEFVKVEQHSPRPPVPPEVDHEIEFRAEEEAMPQDQESREDPVSVVSRSIQTLPVSYNILSLARLQDDPEFTGLSSFEHFRCVFHCLGPAAHHLKYQSRPLDPENEFLLFLVKLRLNNDYQQIGFMFGISKPIVKQIFMTWLNFLYYQFQELDLFIPKDIVEEHLPTDFKSKYPTTRIILDATEVKIQKPSNINDQRATWSTYKNSNTLKTMVGISPRGVVTYVSPAYGGSASDRQIIERSELVKNMFQSGDSIMADRGILVQDLFASQNVRVNTPETMRGKNQLSAHDVVKDRHLASKRVHVERVIGLAKTYRILKSELSHERTPYGSRLIFVCFVLCNFKESIVKKHC